MNKIKQERLKRRLTQLKLADMLGVHINTVNDWELEKKKPNDINKQVIKDVLGLEV